MIQQGLKKYKLGELADITSSKRIFFSDYVEEGVPFYRSKEIIEKANGGDISVELFITLNRYNAIKQKFGTPVDGDLLLAAVGERAGTPYCVKDDGDFYFKDGNLIWFRNFNKLSHSKFLYYYFRAKTGQSELESTMIGSAQKALTIIGLKNLEVSLPSLRFQVQIASVLSSLDGKIELNLQMNKTLEAIAQSIFKEWFVDFQFPGFEGEMIDGLPRGWRKGPLKELVEVKNGYAFKGTDFIEAGVPVIKIKNVKPNKILLKTLSYVSREVADKVLRHKINRDDILITMSGNRIDGTPDTWVGKVALFNRDGEFLLNQRVSVLTLKHPIQTSKYYLVQLLSSGDFQYYFISNGTSSGGQSNISPDLIYKTEIVIPCPNVLKLYDEVVGVLFKKIFINDSEIETLTEIRDLLLPKLMTGKIKVCK